MGLALWLVPKDPVAVEALAALQRRLSHATPSASAPFEPHATLLSGLSIGTDQSYDAGVKDIWSKAQKLLASSAQKPEGKSTQLQGKFAEVVTKGWYFQCIVIALKQNPSLALLNDLARTVYGKHDQPAYFPHLSLLYSDISAEEAEKRISELKADGTVVPVDAVTEGIDGNDSAECAIVDSTLSEGKMSEVVFDTLELWSCDGDVSQWHKLESVDL